MYQLSPLENPRWNSCARSSAHTLGTGHESSYSFSEAGARPAVGSSTMAGGWDDPGLAGAVGDPRSGVPNVRVEEIDREPVALAGLVGVAMEAELVSGGLRCLGPIRAHDERGARDLDGRDAAVIGRVRVPG